MHEHNELTCYTIGKPRTRTAVLSVRHNAAISKKTCETVQSKRLAVTFTPPIRDRTLLSDRQLESGFFSARPTDCYSKTPVYKKLTQDG